MKKILFVCHGNICRSPMAEYVMKDMVHKAGLAQHFEIASAATSREEIEGFIILPRDLSGTVRTAENAHLFQLPAGAVMNAVSNLLP